MLYELHNVSRRFGDRTVLDIDYLAFEPRRIYALIGPNGAGKSTLLSQLAFLDQPTSGEITFRSEPVSYDQAALTRLRRRVVLVDQNPIMFTGSVWKNIEFGLKVRNIPKEERALRIEQALERVSMTQFARLDAHGLSGGEVKRIALARGLALEPEVLLCDEPTANVDSEHQEIIIKILAHANSVKNTSVIFSTHYLSQSRQIADETILLQNGKLSRHLEGNMFHVRLVRRGEQLACLLADRYELSFSDPQSQGRENQRVRIHIDPRKIGLTRPDQPGSDPSEIHGKIVSITVEKKQVRLVVDIGVDLQLLLGEADFLAKPYQVHQEVGVSIPAGSVELIP